MKKFLLMALSVAAIVSCQKNVDSPAEPKTTPGEPDLTAPMLLSAGGNLQTKAGGIGSRNYKFEAGDVIGVFAAMCKTEATTVVADWANIYFANKPATFKLNATEPLIDSLTFEWGTPGNIGTLKNDQFYPSKDRSIFVYAYYPYSAQADSIKLSDVCTSTGKEVPTRFFSLVEGKIAESTEPDDVKAYVNRTQPDYMWAVGKSMFGADLGVTAPTALDSVRRSLRLDTMTFKHALAQLNFGVYLSDPKATRCRFDSIYLTVPKNGAYDLIGGNTKIVTPSSATAADSVRYEITACNGEDITSLPVGESVPEMSKVLNILKTFPLMIMPTTAVELSGCRIEIVVDYGEVGTPDKKKYVINMKDNVGSLKPLNKGKNNIIYLGIGQTKIELYCGVAPWVDNDPAENIIIPVE